MYTYGLNNPLTYTDPLGLEVTLGDILGAGARGAARGGARGSRGGLPGAIAGAVIGAGAAVYDACKDDEDNDCKQACTEQLERDEAECLVAKAGYGKSVQRICLAKAKEYYSQCLRKCDGK